MADNDEYIVRKMNVKFKKEEYEKFTNGEIHSDKGLRTDDGKLSSFPDIEEILDEDECNGSSNNYLNDYNYNYDSKKVDDEANVEALGYIIGGLLIGIQILSDEENRKAIKTWWTDKVVPGIKNKASAITKKTSSISRSVKDLFYGKTKVKMLLKKNATKTTEILDTRANHISTENQNQNQEYFKKYISSEEAQQQIEQIKLLALLLAGMIKEFSNSYIRDDLSPEELEQQQNKIKELTSRKVRNSIKMMIENESFMLEESTLNIFREFLAGKIIVDGKAIPIEINN